MARAPDATAATTSFGELRATGSLFFAVLFLPFRDVFVWCVEESALRSRSRQATSPMATEAKTAIRYVVRKPSQRGSQKPAASAPDAAPRVLTA